MTTKSAKVSAFELSRNKLINCCPQTYVDFVLRLPLEIPVAGGPTSTTMLPKYSFQLNCNSTTILSSSRYFRVIESLMVAVKNGSPSIVRVGLLRLICVWIDNCSSAIKVELLINCLLDRSDTQLHSSTQAVLQNPIYLPFVILS